LCEIPRYHKSLNVRFDPADFADKLVQIPPNLHRKALVDLGVQLTDATIAGDKPRSSIMLDG
jgi:hypothetical protein